MKVHFNGILALSELGRGKCDPEQDFQHRRYCPLGGPLERIDVTRVRYDSMGDYAFKGVLNGKIAWDDILILPRTNSEL